MTTLTLLMTCACAAVMSGYRREQEIDGSGGPSGGVVAVPLEYIARLEQRSVFGWTTTIQEAIPGR